MQNKVENIKELLEIIDSEVKIENVISNYIHIEKKGNNYIALCPFHSDSNPSLIISPTKKIFKCFSCGAGGGTIKFVQNFENINFIDALKKVSELGKIDWSNYLSNKKIYIDPEEELIKKINLEASNFFKFNLQNKLNDPQNNEVKSYINKRKLTNEVITKYKIGYASSKNELINFLLKKKFKEEEILKAKLVTNYNGKLLDFFKDRIIFPIFNKNNEVIAFSGRSLIENDKFAKYLNSQETKVFNKQKVLYNINNAENKIHLKNKAILVEGFMDNIAFSNLGYENVVATMGTNFSKYHLEYLSNLTKNFILCFDNDNPGIKTTIEVGSKILDINCNVSVIKINKVKDFDEFVKNNSNEEILNQIENPISFINFVLEITLNKPNLAEEDIHFLIKMIKKEKDGIKRENYLNFIKQTINKKFVHKLVNEQWDEVITPTNINPNIKTKNVEVSNLKKIQNKIEETEFEILVILLDIDKFFSKKYSFFTKKFNRFYNKIYNITKSKDNWNLEKLDKDLTENELILYNEIINFVNLQKTSKKGSFLNESDYWDLVEQLKEKNSFLINEYTNIMLLEKIHHTNEEDIENLNWLINKVNK